MAGFLSGIFCPQIFSFGVIRVSLLTLYRVRTRAVCLIVHDSIGECAVTSKDWIVSLRPSRYVFRRLSPRLHCSDGCVSVTLVVEFANFVLQDDILLPLCPVATEELLLCLLADKSVHTQVTHPLGCCRNNIGPGTIVAWMAPEEVSALTRKTRNLPRASISLPFTRGQTEVEARLRRFSSVLDASPRDSTHILHQG